jgi:CDGSH-type Zn-finger protein
MGKVKKTSEEQRLEIIKDGPCRVYGKVPLRIQVITPNQAGLSWDWKTDKVFKTADSYDLCRCGASDNKPFCNGSHASMKFNDKLYNM